MRILLDTNILLWAVGRSERLDGETMEALSDAANDVLFSAASIWEIGIKFALRRTDFAIAPDDILQGALAIGFAELPVSAATAATVAVLPPIHRDPFDRLLIAQAIAAPAVLYTADARLTAYSELVRRVG
ncbi:MAG TPA: type II toxin-antitoxin system VapC family toxin [Stellaceae bacterium]|nr:type II toxin-antitoxin system VapC family toxin [Stellaceae bacterium]